MASLLRNAAMRPFLLRYDRLNWIMGTELPYNTPHVKWFFNTHKRRSVILFQPVCLQKMGKKSQGILELRM
jgi:hypothetical protein